MSIDYAKHNHDDFFRDLENPDFTNLSDIQNYVPVYNEFFDLNNKNSRNINFATKHVIVNINEKLSYNNYNMCIANCETKEKTCKKVYCKFSPLIDPIKYTMGKYKDVDENTFYQLPNQTTDDKNTNIMEKYKLIHNNAYVDALFSYTSSKLKDNGFVHANDYYGMFLANQYDFRMNVEDDLEYMMESQFFHNNKHTLFEIENADELFVQRSFKYKKPIVMQEDLKVEDIVDVFPDDIIDTIFEITSSDTNAQILNVTQDLSATMMNNMVYENESHSGSRSHKGGDGDDDDISSTCSSSSSVTDNGLQIEGGIGNSENDYSDESGSDSGSDSGSESDSGSDGENDTMVVIHKFPVLAIFTECCENTLDKYMLNNDISDREWTSIMFQIIVILMYYQKHFQFTHNDLHSCNIVYENTDEQFLYYKIDEKVYKVPTHGRVFKIIDFGRSIFTINDKRFCSDSFSKGEDADTQYNTEPFYNEAKPRIEPNYSFDLCRFGCSMYDFFIDDPADEDEECEKNIVANMVREWCLDDNGKNILYKKSGEERYPEFKLYKMIARNVHNHTPTKQLERTMFKRFIMKGKLKNKKVMVI